MNFGYASYYRAMNTRAKSKFSFWYALSDTTNCKYKWGICYVFIRTSLFILMCWINCYCTFHVSWLSLYIVDTVLRTLNNDDRMDDNVDRLHVPWQCKHVIIIIRRIIITLVVVSSDIELFAVMWASLYKGGFILRWPHGLPIRFSAD